MRNSQKGGSSTSVKSATAPTAPDTVCGQVKAPRVQRRATSGPVPGYTGRAPVQPPQVSARTLLQHSYLTGSRSHLQPEFGQPSLALVRNCGLRTLIVILMQSFAVMVASEAEPQIPPSFQARPQQAAQAVYLPPLGPQDLEPVEQQTRGPAATGIARLFPSGALAGRFQNASGHWFDGPSGPVWRMAVVSPHSTRTRLQFQGAELGAGRVWVHDGTEQPHGPYTGAGRFGDGEFWTHSVRGERIVIEWQPEHVPQPGDSAPFSIARVSRSWAAEVSSGRQAPGVTTGKDYREREEIEARRSAIPRHWTEVGDVKEVPRRLRMGQPSGFDLPESVVPTLHSGARSFSVRVPDGTDSVRVEVTAVDPTARVHLYVRREHASAVEGGTVIADWGSEGVAGLATITIDSNSNPPLRGGEWRVSLGILGGMRPWPLCALARSFLGKTSSSARFKGA